MQSHDINIYSYWAQKMGNIENRSSMVDECFGYIDGHEAV